MPRPSDEVVTPAHEISNLSRETESTDRDMSRDQLIASYMSAADVRWRSSCCEGSACL